MTQPVWKHVSGLLSLGGDLGIALGGSSGGNTPNSAVFPAADDAIFVPLYLNQAVLVKRLFVVNGTAVSGNIDVGIYSKDGARIVSSGSTAQTGTNAMQFFDITDFMLTPGCYYWALSLDNGTGTVFRANLTLPRAQAIALAKQATAFPLPSTATFAAPTAAFLPLMGAEVTEIK